MVSPQQSRSRKNRFLLVPALASLRTRRRGAAYLHLLGRVNMVYFLSSSEDTAASRTVANRTPRMTMSIQEDENHGRRTKKWYRQWGYVKYSM